MNTRIRVVAQSVGILSAKEESATSWNTRATKFINDTASFDVYFFIISLYGIQLLN